MRLEKQKPGLRDFSHQHGLHGGFEAVEVKKWLHHLLYGSTKSLQHEETGAKSIALPKQDL
jgi:hypothetical protein